MKSLRNLCGWLVLICALEGGVQLLAAELTKAELKEADKTWKLHQAAAKKALKKGDIYEVKQSYRLAIQTAEKFGADDKRLTDTLESFAEIAAIQLDYAEAAAALERALAGKQNRLGDNHSDVHFTRANLGSIYGFQKRHDEAEQMFTRSLEGVKRKFGAYHPIVGRVYNGLGNVYLVKGDYAKAEDYYKQAMAIAESERTTIKHDVDGELVGVRYAADHAGLASTRNNLAMVYEKQGKFAEAEKLFQDSFSAIERAAGKNSPALLEGLNNLTSFYLRAHKYPQAEQTVLRSMAITERAKQADPSDLITLIDLYSAWTDNPEATAKRAPLMQRLKDALKIEAEEPIQDLPGLIQYALSLENQELASLLATAHTANQLRLLPAADPGLYQKLIQCLDLLAASRNYDTHQKIISLVVDDWEQDFGSDDRRVLILQVRAAGGLVQERNLEAAAKKFATYLPALEKMLAASDPELVQAQWQQAELKRMQGDMAGAFALYQKSFAQLDKSNPANEQLSLDMLQQLAAMGVVLKDTEALTYLRLLLEKLEQKFGASHAELMDPLLKAGDFYWQQDKLTEAENYYTRSLAIQSRHRGADNIVLVPILDKLMPLYTKAGKTTELEGLYKQRVAIYEKTFGPKHPSRMKATQDYAAWLRAQGRNDEATKLEAP